MRPLVRPSRSLVRSSGTPICPKSPPPHAFQSDGQTRVPRFATRSKSKQTRFDGDPGKGRPNGHKHVRVHSRRARRFRQDFPHPDRNAKGTSAKETGMSGYSTPQRGVMQEVRRPRARATRRTRTQHESFGGACGRSNSRLTKTVRHLGLRDAACHPCGNVRWRLLLGVLQSHDGERAMQRRR